MEILDKYISTIDTILEDGYSDNVKERRKLVVLKSYIKRLYKQSLQAKAYQQAIAKFNAEHPQYGYDLQGYILDEQNKLNK